jgi:hypothetical protein
VSNAAIWGMIDAEEIVFPLEIDEFNSAWLLFSVPAAAARSLMPTRAFELVEHEPGWAHLIVAALDFRRNPWGDYDEINFSFLARPAGATEDAEAGGLLLRTLVNQRFSYEAGARAMQFPRAEDDIDVAYTDDTVTFDLSVGGDHTLTLRVPRARPEGESERMSTVGYSYIDGVARCTHVEIDMPTGIAAPDAVSLELGAGTLAAELRRLGLPRSPDFCAWGEGLFARFGKPQPV